MNVYYLTDREQLQTHIAEGLKRATKRFYVFKKWDFIELILESQLFDASISGESNLERLRVIVLNVDEDMLVQAPIPQSHISAGISAQGLNLLQINSFYIETDLSPARIIKVKDAYGNNISKYKIEGKKYSPLLRFLKNARNYWGYFSMATIAGIGKFLIPLIFPWILRIIVDGVISNQALSTAAKSQKVIHLVLLALGANLVWMGATYIRGVFTAIAGNSMIRDLRVALFNHVQRLSHQFFVKRQTGAIVSRLVNDIAQAQHFVGSALTNVWMDGILLIVLLIILLKIHTTLTLIALALMPIFLFSLRLVGRRIRLASREVQQRVEVLSGGLQEKIAGVTIVKGFTRENEELNAFTSQANKLYSKVVRSLQYGTVNEMLVGLVILSTPTLVTWYGANEIIQNRLSIGELTQFLLYLNMFYGPIQRLSELNVVLANSLAAIERIFEYFEIQPHVVELPNAQILRKVKGLIQFDAVCFEYEPGIPVIKNVSFEIKPGEKVAFVGPSGSGKSTLANLVPRFYDPQSGIIRLDGIDLKKIKLQSLREHIGIVNQDTIFFSGTVRENLLLANPNAIPSEIGQALKAANAYEFVDELSEGLWTELGERGVMLSGGQKQRWAIARAFLKNPKILILDEATSALDSRSEHLIQDALDELLKGRTSIIIAHRLSTVINADKIVVLDRGQIVEIGTHSQLLERGGLYSQLYHEQFFHVASGGEN